MSYDVVLPNGDEINMTFNIRPMLDKAFGLKDWKEIQNHSSKEVAEKVAYAICRMKANPKEYKKLEPENKWGTYEGTIEFLTTIFKACEEESGGINIMT